MGEFVRLWPFECREREAYVVTAGDNWRRVLIANTCAWMREHAGCTVCNFSARAPHSAGIILEQNQSEILDALEATGPFDIARIYMNGSFFNEQEIAMATACSFISAIQERCHPTRIKVESRPEYLDPRRVKAILSPDLELEIGVGLETTNDDIREISLNKGFTYEQFLSRTRPLVELCSVRVYLLVKPPFLSDRAAIEDVIRSVERLLEDGYENISISPVAVQRDTLLEFLVQERLYRPVWLWSLIELNTRLQERFPDRSFPLRGLWNDPETLVGAFNCMKCSQLIRKRLEECPTLSWSDEPGGCDCLSEWRSAIDERYQISLQRASDNALERLRRVSGRSTKIRDAFGSAEPRLLVDPAKQLPPAVIDIDSVHVGGLKVGIHVARAYVSQLTGYGVSDSIHGVGKVEAGVRLDALHRGIHVSRIIASIQGFEKNEIRDLHVRVEEVLDDILDGQKETTGHIRFSADLVLPGTNPLSGTDTRFTLGYTRLLRVSRHASLESEDRYTLRVPIFCACPCTLGLSRDVLKQNSTHTQRGEAAISVTGSTVLPTEILPLDSLALAPHQLMKREDELELVSKGYTNAAFCEDICRSLTAELQSRFAGRGGKISVQVRTHESIHLHDLISVKEFDL